MKVTYAEHVELQERIRAIADQRDAFLDCMKELSAQNDALTEALKEVYQMSRDKAPRQAIADRAALSLSQVKP